MRYTESEFFSRLAFLLAVLIETGDVKTLAGNECRQSDFFPSTHWSVVLASGRGEAEPEVAQAALAELCQIYWAPLYSFVRSRGYTVHDAQDLTQSFFAYLIEHKIYARVDREKGRFRSFLLASMKNFLAHASDRERTLKRGGGQNFLPLPEEQIENAESLFQTHSSTSSEDRVFDRSWAAALVTAGLERLAADYKGESKEKLFRELRAFLGGGAGPPHSLVHHARGSWLVLRPDRRSHRQGIRPRGSDSWREAHSGHTSHRPAQGTGPEAGS